MFNQRKCVDYQYFVYNKFDECKFTLFLFELSRYQKIESCSIIYQVNLLVRVVRTL